MSLEWQTVCSRPPRSCLQNQVSHSYRSSYSGPAGADSEEMAVDTAVPVPTFEDMNSAAPVEAWLEGRGSPHLWRYMWLGVQFPAVLWMLNDHAPYVPVPSYLLEVCPCPTH